MVDFRLPAAPGQLWHRRRHDGIVAVVAGRQPAGILGRESQPGIVHAGCARDELREQDFVGHAVDCFERVRNEFGPGA
jgi:hypothetical protein